MKTCRDCKSTRRAPCMTCAGSGVLYGDACTDCEGAATFVCLNCCRPDGTAKVNQTPAEHAAAQEARRAARAAAALCKTCGKNPPGIDARRGTSAAACRRCLDKAILKARAEKERQLRRVALRTSDLDSPMRESSR